MVARKHAATLVAGGAEALVLTGSVVTGHANRESDIDLVAIGDGPEYHVSRVDGWLVATSYQSAEVVRRGFRSPRDVGTVVPGWRVAEILHDPAGIAARLQDEARQWSWDQLPDEHWNSWVAEEITGYAEEVHKLVNLLETGNLIGAAVQRSILALRLAPILAVHLRLLYRSENRLWNSVADVFGTPWRDTQHSALGIGDEPLEGTCRAALELYVLAAREVESLFSQRQRRVVCHACRLAGYDLNRSG